MTGARGSAYHIGSSVSARAQTAIASALDPASWRRTAGADWALRVDAEVPVLDTFQHIECGRRLGHFWRAGALGDPVTLATWLARARAPRTAARFRLLRVRSAHVPARRLRRLA